MKVKSTFIYLASACIIGFVAVLLGNNTSGATWEMEDLKQLTQAFTELDGEIIEWSLYAREPVYIESKEDWNVKKQQLERQFPEAHWTMNTNEFTGKIDFEFAQVTIRLLNNNDHGISSSFLTYELQGFKWDEDSKKFAYKTSSEQLNKLFSKMPIVFSCIKGEFNMEMDEFTTVSLHEFMSSLEAFEIESIKEEEFQSISAYSSRLTQNIALPDTQMNMQIGIRKNELGARTTLVVGTPILTIEY